MLGVYIILLLIVFTSGLQECELCSQDNTVCINVKKCQAMEGERNNTKKDDQICGVHGTDQLVCCNNTPYTDALIYNTKYVTSVYPSRKNHEISKSMCTEYHNQLNSNCMRGYSLYSEYNRVKCRLTIDEPSDISVDAARGEYPHMALVGTGPRNALIWICSGIIVSSRYILTTAHCSNSRQKGKATFVKVGILKIDNENFVYAIYRAIPHPDHEQNSIYNDIALIDVYRNIEFNEFTSPACLHTGETIQDDVVSSAGWMMGYNGATNVMQKITLRKTPNTNCTEFLKKQNLKINLTTGMCYSYTNNTKSEGYLLSGSPLQLKSDNYCMWTVTGFVAAVPKYEKFNVYTRVAPYVPWIESVVWD